MHRYRDPIRSYVDGSGKCLWCGAFFHTRLRVLAHMNDRRNTICKPHILESTFPKLAEHVVLELEARDAEMRRAGLKSGHTHPIAQGSAVSKEGKRVGHVQH